MRSSVLMVAFASLCAAPAFADCVSDRAQCLAENVGMFRVDVLDCKATFAADRRDCADYALSEIQTCGDDDLALCERAARLVESSCRVESHADEHDCLATAHTARVEADTFCACGGDL